MYNITVTFFLMCEKKTARKSTHVLTNGLLFMVGHCTNLTFLFKSGCTYLLQFLLRTDCRLKHKKWALLKRGVGRGGRNGF